MLKGESYWIQWETEDTHGGMEMIPARAVADGWRRDPAEKKLLKIRRAVVTEAGKMNVDRMHTTSYRLKYLLREFLYVHLYPAG